MNFGMLDTRNQDEVTRLFTSVFTASEGKKEGELIGRLAGGLSARADNQEIVCVGALDDGAIVGAIFLTRLVFAEPVRVYLLAPVAVSTAHQGKGVGQALIAYGLNEMKRRCVAAVVTYGDPSYYSRVGFEPLAQTVIRAPLELSMPHGWLGQSLTGVPIAAIDGRPACVREFDDPVYW